MLTRQQLYELYYQGSGPTLDYIEALLAELADFERIYGQHQQRIIETQRQYNEKLAQQLKRAKEKLWHQQSLNYQLKRRIAELEAATITKDSHNSSLPPSMDPLAAKAAHAIKRTRSLRRPSGRRPGAQAGHPGRTRSRVDRPDQVVTHTPRECRGCGVSLASGYTVKCECRQVIDIPPVRPFVVEHRALTKRCATCDVLTKGRFPKEVRAALQYGPRVRARAVYLVNYQLLPYRRAGELLTDFFSCHICESVVENEEKESDCQLSPTVDHQRVSRAHFAGSLNLRLFLNPVEQTLNGLPDATHQPVVVLLVVG